MPTNKSHPQYAVIAKALVRDISKGRYPIGSMLPPELDLARHFKVSRNTMRSALRVLVDMGLISRRAGRGTQVQMREIQPNYVQTLENLDVLFPNEAGAEAKVSAGKNVTVDADLALLLASPRGSSWLKFQVQRYAGAGVLDYSLVYVVPQLRTIKSRLVKNDGPFHHALEKASGQPVVQLIRQADAAAANAEVAKALSVPEGSPVLRTATRYADENGRILMVVDTYSPPGQQHHTVHFRMNWRGDQED